MNEPKGFFYEEIIKRLLFGQFIIACCAVALVEVTYIQLRNEIRFDALCGFVFFSTLFLYNMHRWMGISRIAAEDYGPITGWAAKHRFTLMMLMIVGAGASAFYFFQLKSQIMVWIIALGVFSLLYEWPLIRYNQQFQRVRNLWLFKIFLITGVWTLTTVLLPAINLGIPLSLPAFWSVFGERVAFILTLALCFDVRDIEFDRRDGLTTVPILFGIENVKRIYRVILVLWLILIVVHYWANELMWGNGLAMILSAVATFFVVKDAYPRKSDYYYLFYVDGLMVLQFLLCAVFYHIRS
jgi:4-hydroxybenzoate polyprenyltransferase